MNQNNMAPMPQLQKSNYIKNLHSHLPASDLQLLVFLWLYAPNEEKQILE